MGCGTCGGAGTRAKGNRRGSARIGVDRPGSVRAPPRRHAPRPPEPLFLVRSPFAAILESGAMAGAAWAGAVPLLPWRTGLRARRGPAPMCGRPGRRQAAGGRASRGAPARAGLDFSDPDTVTGVVGAVLGLAVGIGVPVFYISRDNADEARLEELRELNRETFKATGEYLTEVGGLAQTQGSKQCSGRPLPRRQLWLACAISISCIAAAL